MAQKADGDLFRQPATFTTLITTPRAIEGLTGDNDGNHYLGGSGAQYQRTFGRGIGGDTIAAGDFTFDRRASLLLRHKTEFFRKTGN